MSVHATREVDDVERRPSEILSSTCDCGQKMVETDSLRFVNCWSLLVPTFFLLRPDGSRLPVPLRFAGLGGQNGQTMACGEGSQANGCVLGVAPSVKLGSKESESWAWQRYRGPHGGSQRSTSVTAAVGSPRFSWTSRTQGKIHQAQSASVDSIFSVIVSARCHHSSAGACACAFPFPPSPCNSLIIMLANSMRPFER